MFKNLAPGNVLSRQQRRLTVVAQQTARNRGHQQQTHRNAVRQLTALEQRQQQRRGGQRNSSPKDMTNRSHYASSSAPGYTFGSGAAQKPSLGSSTHYDQQEMRTGNSVLQEQFDELVKESLLRYGPPLPAELVADNHMATSASSSSADLGADGRSFEMHDEVPLKMTELFVILKRQKPSFTIQNDCDGVPLALMVKNCSYLRAFGGKVRYMRFFKRDKDHDGSNVISVSIGKYKMREYPSQDGLRQGPQPWLYSYGMK